MDTNGNALQRLVELAGEQLAEMRNMRSELGEVNERLGKIESGQAQLSKRFDRFLTDQGHNLNTRVSDLERRMTDLERAG